MTATPPAIDKIRDTVSVCRSFRLNGLQEVLKRTQSEITPVALIWQVGDLNAQGFLETNISNFIVKRDQAKKVSSELGETSSRELHEEWREWYREEYGRYFNVEDLAELLFHEAASLPEEETRLESIKNKTLQYLWEYYDGVIAEQQLDLQKSFEFDDERVETFQSAFPNLISRISAEGDDEKSHEIQQFIKELLGCIEGLNRFDEVLSESEYAEFRGFLTSLFPQLVK